MKQRLDIPTEPGQMSGLQELWDIMIQWSYTAIDNDYISLTKPPVNDKDYDLILFEFPASTLVSGSTTKWKKIWRNVTHSQSIEFRQASSLGDVKSILTTTYFFKHPENFLPFFCLLVLIQGYVPIAF